MRAPFLAPLLLLATALVPAQAASDLDNLRALASRLKDERSIIDFRIVPADHVLDLDLGLLSADDADDLVDDVCSEALEQFAWSEEWTIRGFPMAWTEPAAECSTD